MAGAPNSKSSRFATALIAIFIGFLCLPALDAIFHLDHAPMPNENRSPAKFPEFNGVRHTGDFIAGLENYFNDHFGFRNRLIRWNNHWKHELFGSADGSSVIVGRNGWLFYNGNTVPEVTGQSRFSEKQLQAWQKLLETRRDWLARRKIKYLFVIAPDKHSVYPEYLPDWLVPGRSPSKVDQFVNYMRGHSSVPILALRDCLVAAKSTRTTYLLTDSHWNNFGAFVACQEMVKALSRSGPQLAPLPLDDFKVGPMPGVGGDLARLLGTDASTPETQQVRITPKPPLQPLQRVKDIARLIKKKPHEFDGVITTNSLAAGKALIFRDSFSEALVPLLGYNFNQAVYIWRYDWDPATLEREKPDVVIDEMVERMFDSEDPVKLLHEDHLD